MGYCWLGKTGSTFDVNFQQSNFRSRLFARGWAETKIRSETYFTIAQRQLLFTKSSRFHVTSLANQVKEK